MLEESISCSPGRETNRSQSRRLHCRFKRKHRRPENLTSPTEVSCLKGLYEESDHALNSTQYEHFNPFQNEKLLAAVDMVRVPKSPSTSRDMPLGRFVKFEDLPMKEDDDFQEVVTHSPHNQTNSELHAQYGPETQFGITESEFVRFCDDAEMDVKEPTSTPTETPQNKNTVEEMILENVCESSPTFKAAENECTTANSSKTPQTKKSVVEAILEDFCASPFNESPPKTIAENATPVFRFRSICIRTYAGTRRRRLRRNIDTEFANAQLTDDDGSVSDSSGLSVQEDLTQSVVPQLDTVDLNCSIKVCENLLNLSSYFSQATSHDKTPQSSEEQRSRHLSEVVGEIIQLKRRSYEVTRRKSTDEFYGFSDGDSIEEFHGFSDEESKSSEHTVKELLDAEDDVLEHINCDSLCYETVQPKTSFSYDVSDLKFGMERVKSVIDDAKKFMQSISGNLDAEESDTNPTVCDSLKSLPRKLSEDSSVKEEALFEDINLWNDNECLLNYVTQKPNLKQETCLVETEISESDIDADSTVKINGFGFSTASRKPIVISEEAKSKAHEFWSKFEQSEKEREKENLNSACHEKVVTEQRTGFTVSSRKPLVSEAAKLKTERKLPEAHPPDETPLTSSFSKAHPSRHILTVSCKANENRRKSDGLSDYVKQEAEDLLRDIEFFEDGFEEEQKAGEIDQFIACIEAPSKPQYEDFKTASKKPISVSDEAKRLADLLVREVRNEDMPKDFLESLQAELEHDTSSKALTEYKAKGVMTFEGFKTASKKPIQISEDAKRRAAQLCKDLQSADLPREFLECIQADLKDGDSSTGVSKDNAPTKVKFEGFKTASKKPIQISEVAKRRAAQISKDVQTADLPREFLECIEADLKDDDSSSRSGMEQGTTDVRFEGFKTASKKPIQISEDAKRRAAQISKDMQTADLPREFLECIQADLKDGDSSSRSGMQQGTTDVRFEGFKTASKKPIQISEDAKRRAAQISKDMQTADLPREFLECIQADLKDGDSSSRSGMQQGTTDVRFEGFKTASKKPIQISEDDKRRAAQISKDMQTADLPREFLECIQADLKDGDSSSRSGMQQGTTDVRFEGFKTASKKSIQISEVAKCRAEQISKDVQTADLPREFLECIEADLKEGNSSTGVSKGNASTEVKFEGFKTASKKQIQISDVAKQRAEQMLKEMKSAALPQDFLKCVEADVDNNSESTAVGKHSASLPNQILNAGKQAAEELISVIKPRVHLSADIVECIQSSPRIEGTPKRNSYCVDTDYTKLENRIHHRPCPHEVPSVVLSPQKIKELDFRKAIKRKADILHVEESLISPKRRFSCNDRSPLNDIENAPLHKTSSHPDMKSTHKIVKKNLLSLSKRKKCSSSKQTADTSAASKTPEKSDSSLLRCNANTTPNLKEFFDCVATSTPRLMRTNSKVDSHPKDSSIDADFKRINWENSNNSARVCRTDVNVTCIEVSPSPKQRIERLRMYAEPPPISPILMVNKCRPSGLRRGRSLMKP